MFHFGFNRSTSFTQSCFTSSGSISSFGTVEIILILPVRPVAMLLCKSKVVNLKLTLYSKEPVSFSISSLLLMGGCFRLSILVIGGQDELKRMYNYGSHPIVYRSCKQQKHDLRQSFLRCRFACCHTATYNEPYRLPLFRLWLSFVNFDYEIRIFNTALAELFHKHKRPFVTPPSVLRIHSLKSAWRLFHPKNSMLNRWQRVFCSLFIYEIHPVIAVKCHIEHIPNVGCIIPDINWA